MTIQKTSQSMKFALADSCSDARVDWIRGRRVAFGSPVIGILGQAKIRSSSLTLVEMIWPKGR